MVRLSPTRICSLPLNITPDHRCISAYISLELSILITMDVSSVPVNDINMTLEQYIELLFSLQKDHLSHYVQTKLDVRALFRPIWPPLRLTVSVQALHKLNKF